MASSLETLTLDFSLGLSLVLTLTLSLACRRRCSISNFSPFSLVSPLVLSLFHLAGAGAAQSRLSAAHEAGPGMGLCRKGQSGADRHAGKPAVSSS
jgi:hypothetical protein